MSAPFADLWSAGDALADALAPLRGTPELLVLALPRGGIPAGIRVAERLDAPLDVLMLRRLLVPDGREHPVCAFIIAGNRLLDPEVAEEQSPELEAYLSQTLKGFVVRERICRRARPPLEVRGRPVLLVDNGASTGSTMLQSARALRTIGAGRITMALPLSGTACRAPLEAAADELVCLRWIPALGNVAMGYRHYRVPSYEEVGALLAGDAPPALS